MRGFTRSSDCHPVCTERGGERGGGGGGTVVAAVAGPTVMLCFCKSMECRFCALSVCVSFMHLHVSSRRCRTCAAAVLAAESTRDHWRCVRADFPTLLLLLFVLLILLLALERVRDAQLARNAQKPTLTAHRHW